MIGTINISVNSANPNLPLKTIFSYQNSPSSIRIIDVPKKIGTWKIEKVYVNFNYPDNRSFTKDTKLIGGAFVATVEGSSAVGKSLNGYTVYADGTDENGNSVSGYILGKGDIIILDADGKIEVGDDVIYLHFRDEMPDKPNKGDVIFTDNVYKIYFNDEWKIFGNSINDINSDSYINLEIEKLSFDDYYTKIDEGEQLNEDRLYITSSDYTTGFFKPIVEVGEPKRKDDASTKRYVDDNINETKDEIKLYTDRSIDEVNRNLSDNYLPKTTFIPKFTSELNNDEGFQNSEEVSNIVESMSYTKDLTYNKTEIDNIISSEIRFKIKEISGDVSLRLEDLTLNHIPAYKGQILVLPEKTEGYKRDLQIYMDNPLSNTVNWYIDNYNYVDSLENPVTALVNSDAKYLYDVQDIDDSDSVLIERKSFIQGTYDKGFEPLCFTAEEENSTVKLTKVGSPDSITLQFSYDKDEWFEYEIDQTISCNNIGDKVYFAAGKNGNITLSKSSGNRYQFATTGSFGCSGHVNSLLQFDYKLHDIEIPSFGYSYLFYKCKITSAPILDSVTISNGAYYGMFSESRIVKAPELPAKKVGTSAYSSMFYQCLYLVEPPSEIKTKDFPKYSCNNMFYNCNRLSTTPKISVESLDEESFNCAFQACKSLSSTQIEILADELPKSACANMFTGCSELTTTPTIESSIIGERACYQMFSNCKKLENTFEHIGGISIDKNGCNGMFMNCSLLSSAPNLPSDSVGNSAYASMFKGCTGLKIAPELPAKNIEYSCYESMFYGCFNLTTAPSELPATTIPTYAYKTMFYNCSKLTTAPKFTNNAVVELNGCYQMFVYCRALVEAPELPATTLANGSYHQMFYGCSALTKAPSILPATTLANGTGWSDGMYLGMFEACTSLESAPEIMITEFNRANHLNNMFSGCTKLNYVKIHTTSWSNALATATWLNNVSSTGTFVCPESLTIPLRDASGVPEGWTIERF